MNEGLLVSATKADVSIAEEELRLERNSRRDPALNILTMHNLHNCAIARGGRVMDVRGATSFVTSYQSNASTATQCT